MLHVECLDASEIRMGSPFNVCRIRLTGDWIPDLPETDWQDVFSVREDGAAVALIRWDVPGNVPGFRVWVVDEPRRRVSVSDRFPGCCRTIAWRSRTTLVWESFPDLTGVYELEREA